MKIQLLVVGKTTTRYIAEGVEEYSRRLARYIPFEIKVIPDVKRGLSEAKQKELEGEAMMSAIAPQDFVMLLDERGREMTSRELAAFIDNKMVNLPRNLVMVIGGPYGFSPAMYARANAQLSLSRLTFPHELIRLFIVEQLYRAMTILRGEPYHHD